MPGCGGPQVMIEALEKKLAPLSKNTCLRHCSQSCFCHTLSTARMRLCSSPRCLSTLLLPDPHHRFDASLTPASFLGAVCLTISTAWIRLCPLRCLSDLFLHRPQCSTVYILFLVTNICGAFFPGSSHSMSRALPN